MAEIVSKLPVFLPGNNRDWINYDGVMEITSEGVMTVRLFNPDSISRLVELGRANILLQVSFDYRMDAETLNRINNQFRE